MRKLSRKNSHRKSLIRNLATSLILYESIETTLSKAKDVKTFVDIVLSRAKKADLNAIRYLDSVFFDTKATQKTINELLPRYAKRTSGFTKIHKNGYRVGDSAPKAILELIDKKVYVAEANISENKSKKRSKTEDIKDKSTNK